MTAARSLPLLAAAGLAAAPLARAQAPDAPSPAPARAGHFDEPTGRDLLNYPRHPLVDFVHMRLDLTIPDMNVPRLHAVQRLTVRGVRETAEAVLDANLLEIGSVLVDGDPAPFHHDGRRLTVTFAPPLRPGEEREVMTAYTVNDPPDGLYWTLATPGAPWAAPQLHSQGESELNSYWFPCHDFPNDRMTTELVATVPAGFTVSSNGRLVERQRTGDAERWHWRQDLPHVAYLVSLVVGEYDVVDVGTRALPMPVYVPPGRGPDARATFARTPKMVDFFARRFDEPYPWDRYAQVVVWNFNWGGMENTAATTLHEAAVIPRGARKDSSSEGLIAHELAHQWFGDLVTCRSWEHIWLNEGWATYAEALWEEHDRGPDAYHAVVRGNFDAVIGADTGHAPFQPPMVSREYRFPDEVFGRAANPYSKGSAVLHMLRRRLGDEVFFRATAAYLDEFRLGLAETGDFRRTFERVSGEALEQFFTQWCSRPGIPRLSVTLAWDASAGTLSAAAEQTQHIDERNPAFAFTLPLLVAHERGVTALELPMDGRSASIQAPLASPPRFVAVDPDLHVLADVKVAAPAQWWPTQLSDGPTLASRIQAARELGRSRPTDDRGTLLSAARSEREPAALRREAIAALRARADAAALAALADRGVRDPWVRENLIDALGDLAAGDPGLWAQRCDWFIRLASADSSERTRAAAVRALGRSKDATVLGHVAAAAAEESYDDRVRRAALGALADLDVPEALPLAVARTDARYPGGTRADAARAVARLGRHDPAAAYAALRPLLNERFDGLRSAAAQALADLGEARALADLQGLIDSARTPWDRHAAEEWKRALERKAGGGVADATAP